MGALLASWQWCQRLISFIAPASTESSLICIRAQAYVRQQDLFYSQLTVRETLLM